MVLTTTNYVLNCNYKLNYMSLRRAGEKMEEFEMPTKNTGDMVVRAMRWALAHGHTAEEAYDLATYMTGNELPEKEAEKEEKKE